MLSIEVLEPTGTVADEGKIQLSPIPNLTGCRLGILGNTKPNFAELAKLLAQRIDTEHELAGIEYFQKENATVGATEELLDRIVKSVDLVLTGSAD